MRFLIVESSHSRSVNSAFKPSSQPCVLRRPPVCNSFPTVPHFKTLSNFELIVDEHPPRPPIFLTKGGQSVSKFLPYCLVTGRWVLRMMVYIVSFYGFSSFINTGVLILPTIVPGIQIWIFLWILVLILMESVPSPPCGYTTGSPTTSGLLWLSEG